MRTNIVKWGNSRGVRLPKYLLERVNLTDNDAVEITTEGNIIMIKKVENRRHRTLKERLEGMDTANYAWQEWNTDPPVGNEVF